MFNNWFKNPVLKFSSIACGVLGIFVFSALISCEKGPGEGGTSSIIGRVEVFDNQIQEFYPGADEDVYLIYGDDITCSERIKSSFDGRFEFKYLREGSYTVYVYSDSLTGSQYTITAVKRSIEIIRRKQQVDAGTFQIKKY